MGIYVADASRRKIIHYNLDGTFDFEFGEFGLDVGQLFSPSRIQIVDDVIYVLDDSRDVILLFDLEGNFIREIVFTGDIFDFRVHNNELYLSESMNGNFVSKYDLMGGSRQVILIFNFISSIQVIFIYQGFLYLSFLGRLTRYNLDGESPTIINTNVGGSSLYINDDLIYTVGSSDSIRVDNFLNQNVLIIDDVHSYRYAVELGGNIYAATRSSIRVFDSEGNFIRTIGQSGDNAGQFRSINGILVTPQTASQTIEDNISLTDTVSIQKGAAQNIQDGFTLDDGTFVAKITRQNIDDFFVVDDDVIRLRDQTPVTRTVIYVIDRDTNEIVQYDISGGTPIGRTPVGISARSVNEHRKILYIIGSGTNICETYDSNTMERLSDIILPVTASWLGATDDGENIVYFMNNLGDVYPYNLSEQTFGEPINLPRNPDDPQVLTNVAKVNDTFITTVNNVSGLRIYDLQGNFQSTIDTTGIGNFHGIDYFGDRLYISGIGNIIRSFNLPLSNVTSINLGDISRGRGISIQVSGLLEDFVYARDGVDSTVNVTKTEQDSITVADNIESEKSVVRSEQESIGITDNIVVKKPSRQSLGDSISVEDSVETSRSVLLEDGSIYVLYDNVIRGTNVSEITRYSTDGVSSNDFFRLDTRRAFAMGYRNGLIYVKDEDTPNGIHVYRFVGSRIEEPFIEFIPTVVTGQIKAITFDSGGRIFLLGEDDHVYVYSITANSRVPTLEFDMQTNGVLDITFVGNELYGVVDNLTSVVRINTDTGVVTNAFGIGSSQPVSITSSRNQLYILVGTQNNRRLFVYNTDSTLVGIHSFDSLNANIRGIEFIPILTNEITDNISVQDDVTHVRGVLTIGRNPNEDIQLPRNYRGVDIVGSLFYLIRDNQGVIDIVNRQGNVTSSIFVTESLMPRGITITDDLIYVNDSQFRRFLEFERNGTLTNVDAPRVGNPRGITHNGINIFSVDRSNNVVVIFDFEQNVIGDFDIEPNSTGITYYDGHLYVVSSGRVFAYDVNTGNRISHLEFNVSPDATYIINDGVNFYVLVNNVLEAYVIGATVINDTIRVVDNVEKERTTVANFPVAIRDDVTITDNIQISKTRALLQFIIDNIRLEDNVLKDRSYNLEEDITVSDDVQILMDTIKLVSDDISIEDSVTQEKRTIQVLTDALNIFEIIQTFKELRVDIEDDIDIDDNITVSKTSAFLRSIVDTISVDDELIKSQSFTRNESENIAIDDTITVGTERTREITDDISIDDNVISFTENLQILFETLNVRDSVTNISAKMRNVVDNISITDNATKIQSSIRNFAESISITDTIMVVPDKFRNIIDRVNIVDRVRTKLRRNTTPEGVSSQVLLEKKAIEDWNSFSGRKSWGSNFT